MKLRVGTSGYSYKEWLGKFYPERMPPQEMLQFYAARFSTVEINNTFYRLPKESVLTSWAAQVPEGFRFVLKAPQRITHIKRLKEAAGEVDYFFRTAAVLGSAAGAILFQLPPNLKKDLGRLRDFFALLPEGQNIAFEFRHPSWHDDEVYDCLRSRNCALCSADTDDSEPCHVAVTANWGYIRLRRQSYSGADLLQWKNLMLAQPWTHAYVFLKHEDEAMGPKLAAEFIRTLNSEP